MVELIQISDFHFGSKEFNVDLLLNVINYINDQKPDFVVCTGDITDKGKFSQYQEVKPYLEKIKIPFIVVPGNHDAKNNGLIFFEKFINSRRTKTILESKDTIILGLNSARDDVSEGELGDEQLEWTVHQLQACQLENRIMALHHHLIAVPYSGRQRNTLVDAGDVLEMARFCNVDLVLMGHKHVPHAYVLGSLTLLYCGTSCSEKVRADEPPCFNRIILDEDTIKVSLVNSINLEESLLLSRKRGEKDYIKPRKTRIDHILQANVFQNSP